MKQKLLIVLSLLLAMTLTSCGAAPASPAQSAPSQDKAAPAAQPQPTSTPVPPTPVPPTKAPPTTVPTVAVVEQAEDLLDFGEVSDLNRLSSYRASHKVSWESSDGTKGATEMLIEFVKDPPAQRMVIQDLEGGSSTEMVFVDGTTYLGTDGDWVAIQTSADDYMNQLGWWGMAQELANSGEGKFIGTETVNGVSAKHYRLTEKDINAQLPQELKVDKITVDVWVVPADDIYVKYVMDWTGIPDEKSGMGTFHIESNLIDYNQPITIQAPEGVAKPETPEDIPVMEGATEMSLMGGVTSYQVAAAQADVISFYQTEMVANGWEAEQSFAPTMLAFTKGERTATVIVGDETDGKVSVTIMSE